MFSLPPAAVLQALLEALESAGLGCTIVVNRDGRLERAYANEALARIFGLRVEDLRALPPLTPLAGPERERLSDMQTAIDAGQAPRPHLLETAIQRDGVSVPVEVGLGYSTLEGANATFVFMRDISAKTAMAEALRESEERFRRVAEASPDSITVFAKGKYLYANPVALRILGLKSLDELSRVDPWALVPADRRDVVLERTARLVAGEKIPPLELRHAGPDGKETILEASISLTPIGGEQAIISYSRDITERMRLQAELMKRDRLASVGMLAAGVAHELNNPLASLGMQARKLRADADKHGLPPDVRQALEQMDEAASRMNSIIADLLFMARPVEQPQAHVDVAQIVQSTISLLCAGVPRCPPIETELEPLPPIQGYSSKLGQVFLNVLRNAVQAVEGVSEGSIRVRARVVDEAIEVEVADNGGGIPSELLPRIAQPFFTTKPHGTGLGLWISQALMAHHGGSLDLESVAGEGTTVTLRFPQNVPVS